MLTRCSPCSATVNCQTTRSLKRMTAKHGTLMARGKSRRASRLESASSLKLIAETLSVQQILVATLITGVIVSGGTVIIVIYTGFGRDFRRFVTATVMRIKHGIGIAFRTLLASFRNHRPFWVAVL